MNMNRYGVFISYFFLVLGLYYLTKERVNALGEGMIFNSCEECRRAYYVGFVSLHAKVKVRMNPVDSESDIADQIVETTVGRIIFWDIIPSGIPFSMTPRVRPAHAVDRCRPRFQRVLRAGRRHNWRSAS